MEPGAHAPTNRWLLAAKERTVLKSELSRRARPTSKPLKPRRAIKAGASIACRTAKSILKHAFSVGQIVELKPSILLRLAASGEYEITHLMPEPDVSSASPRYRIKSREEVYQRIVSEDELALSGGPVTA